MSNPRKQSIHGNGESALTPDFSQPSPPVAIRTGLRSDPLNAAVIRSDDPSLITWWKRLLYQERRRHGKIESILERQISQLEQQVSDLRQLYIKSLVIKVSEKK